MNYLPLKKQKEFLRVLKQGKRYKSATLTLVAADAKEPRYAVCVGKKFGKSVVRNRIKRLLREAFRANSKDLAGSYSILLIPKLAETYSYDGFCRDLKGIVQRARMLAPSQGEPIRS